MSKVVAEFDTVTKKATVTIDGVVVENLDYMSISSNCCGDTLMGEDDEFSCCMRTRMVDKANKSVTVNQLYASTEVVSPSGKTIIINGKASKYPGFNEQASFNEETAKWFRGLK